MKASLFLEIIEKYFKAVVGAITEKFNGGKKEQTMLHKTMLTEEYSADLTWGSTELSHSVVAADVVALDSSLPLKKRGAFSNATGSLPKLGVKYRKGERDISDINVMRARGADEGSIASKIFDDVAKCIKSMDVRKEIMFLESLSTGMTSTTEEDNDGTCVRVNYGYKEENFFRAKTAPWGEGDYNPIEDIQQLFDKASEDSNTIGIVLISKKYFNFLRSSVYGKKLVADFRGQVYTTTKNLNQPSRQVMLEALEDEFSATFRIVDSTFRIQNHDGSYTSVKPWEEANVVGVPGEVVGRLVYGTLAEETNPVECVTYEKSGSHVLISKFSKTDPLEEFTAAQAICLPVIDGADSIYLLKADSIAVLDVGSPTVDFEASASSESVKVYAENEYTLSQTASTSWLTVTKGSDGKTVTLAVSANTGAERTSTVTITDSEGNTETITVTQAAGNAS